MLYVPNMVLPTNAVNSCFGSTLVTWSEIRPNIDQNNDCSVSNSLKNKNINHMTRWLKANTLIIGITLVSDNLLKNFNLR